MESFEAELDRMKTWMRNQDEAFEKTIKEMLETHKDFMDRTTGTMSIVSKNIIAIENKIAGLEVASSTNEVTVRGLVDFRVKAYETLEAVKKDLAHTKETKLDKSEFGEQAGIIH